jgi:hypothetical protein
MGQSRAWRAVEERNGAGGVEGAEVATGPAELEVDADGMEAARAAALRQRGLQCGGSTGRSVEAARAAASMRRRRSGRSPRWLPALGQGGVHGDTTPASFGAAPAAGQAHRRSRRWRLASGWEVAEAGQAP